MSMALDNKNMISHELLELYCLGLASDEEVQRVEAAAMHDKLLKKEIEVLKEALGNYAEAHSRKASEKTKKNIFDAIDAFEKNLPPDLSSNSNVEDWIKFLELNNITAPDDFEYLHMDEFLNRDGKITYAAWGRSGASLSESHDDEDEHLLVLKGSCTLEQNGILKHYTKGDLIFIPKQTVHTACVTGENVLLVIGQRRVVR